MNYPITKILLLKTSFLLVSAIAFSASVRATEVPVAQHYGPLFHVNDHYTNPPGMPSTGEALNDWWQRYKQYWGVSPYGGLSCFYTTTYYGDGPTTGNFVGVTLGGQCGGGGAVVGTLQCTDGYTLSGGSCIPNGSPKTGKNVGDPPTNECSVGNPINQTTGNKLQKEFDFKSVGVFPLQFLRFYNSISDKHPGQLGLNWHHNFETSIQLATVNSVSTAEVVRSDGKYYSFTLQSGSWVADSDVTGKLIRVTNASGAFTGWQYITPNDSVENYDTTGKLLSITQRSGIVLTASYSTSSTPSSIAPRSGLLISIADNFNHSITLVYDASSRIIKVTDPNGGAYGYAYDSNENLVQVSSPDGKLRKYLYENATFKNALTGITDENGIRYATWSYDSQGRAISSQHAGGVDNYQLVYGTNSTTVTDPFNSVNTHNFQTVLGTVKSTGQSQPSGSGCAASSSAMTYDANGNIATKTDFNGNITTYTYDLSRNLETQRVEGSGKPEVRTISTQWHPDWRLTTRIAEPLKLTTLVYNGQPDPTNGNTALSCAPATALVNNKPIAVLCKKVEQPTTDSNGSQGFSASPSGTPRIWNYTYTSYGQVLTAKGPRTDVNDTTTYTYYDATDTDFGKRGNLATVTDPLGHVTQITAYDLNSRPLTIIDPNGLTTTLTYDPRGRLTSRSVGSETTAYNYDGVGQLLQVTAPDNSTIHYTYDAAHRLTDIADSLGNTIHYTLDAMGNRTNEAVKDPSGTLVKSLSRSYDALNRLQQLTGIAQE